MRPGSRIALLSPGNREGVLLRNFREPVNGWTHLVAAFAAALGVPFLILIARGDLVKQVSLIVYGASLVLMFSASAAYHSFNTSTKWNLILKKLDHSAIYLLIAGSYTPICLNFFDGFWRIGFLGIIWAIAVIGIALKFVKINSPRWLSAGVYLLMGWLSILATQEILSGMPAGAIAWLVAGGLLFSIGAAIYILKKPDPYPGVFGFHEIWHVFVILGAFSHFAVMAGYIAPG